MDGGLIFVALTIMAILGIALMSGDENNLMNYYVCDECGDIRIYKPEVKFTTCAICGGPCRKIKNW